MTPAEFAAPCDCRSEMVGGGYCRCRCCLDSQDLKEKLSAALSALEEARRERDAARKDASDTQFKWEGTVRALGAALQREKEHIARADAAWRAALEAAQEAARSRAGWWGMFADKRGNRDGVDACHQIVSDLAHLATLPPPSATPAPDECPRCLAFRNGTPFDRAAQIDHSPGCSVGALAVHGLPAAPAEEEKCPEGCKGIVLGDGNHSGCSCGAGKLANGDPRPAGFKCDCPNHAQPVCPDCAGTGVGLRCDTCGEIMGDGPRCERCENVQTNCRACGGSGRAPSRGEVG